MPGIVKSDLDAVDAALARMGALAEAGSAGEIREFLTAFLPEARLDGAGSGWRAAGLPGPCPWPLFLGFGPTLSLRHETLPRPVEHPAGEGGEG